MSLSGIAGIPPKPVTLLLRIEGLTALVAALVGYQALGGNWWLFALLLLTPDLSMLALAAGKAVGIKAYNLAHTYTAPALLAAAGLAAGWTILPPLALIWVAHIGMDRAIGYGLKYPGAIDHTHLGVMGKARTEARDRANAS